MKNKECKFKEYLLKNINVIDVENDCVIEHQNVYIKNGIIEYTGEEEKETEVIIDCDNRYLVPGLINLHVHLFGSGKPSKMVNGKGGSQKLIIRFVHTKIGNVVLNMIVKSCLRKQILTGTTTLRSLGDFLYADVKQRNLINEGKYVGPRVLAAGPALTCYGGHGDGTISVPVSNEKEIKEEIEKHVAMGVDQIKITLTGGVMDGKRGEPGEVKMGPNNVAKIVELAHKNSLSVAAHVESTKGMEVAINASIDTIEHGAPIPEKLIPVMKNKGISITTTISPAYPYATLDKRITNCTEDQAFNAKIVADNIVAAARQAIDNDIKVGLGTDASCPYAFQYNTWREMEYFIKCVHVTNQYAIKTMTIKNAEIIHLEDKIGSVKVGKCADLIVLSNNPYDDIQTYKNPIIVIKNGVLIMNPYVDKDVKYERIINKILKTIE